MASLRIAHCVAPLLAALALAPSTASALECFTLVGAPPTLARTAAQSSTVGVNLAQVMRLNPQCRYGLGPAATSNAATGDEDFASLAARLSTSALRASTAELPRTLYAQAARPGAPLESVFLAQCTSALLGPGGPFELRTDTASRRVVVSRRSPAPADDCGAARLRLNFVSVSPDAHPPTFGEGTPTHSLAPGETSVTLDGAGRFAVYVARSVGVRVGTITGHDPLTPLRNAMATPAAPERPWLRTEWVGDRFTLVRSEGLSDPEVWAEFSTASQSDSLWLADVPERDEPGVPPRVRGSVAMAPEREGVVIPHSLVESMMARRFGPEGRRMVPTVSEWDSLRAGLQLCLPERYPNAHEPTPERLPSGARCARLAAVVPAVALPSTTTPGPRGVCIRRHTWAARASGATSLASLGDTCIEAQRVASPDAPAGPTVIASVGDTVLVDGTDDGSLYACIDNRCRLLHGEAAGDGLRMWRGGLLEVRRATSLDAAMSAQGVTVARVVLVDPGSDWHPLGLYTGAPVAARGDDAPSPWSALLRDAPDVFAYVRRRQALHFRLGVSPAAAAAWNTPGAETVLTETPPVIGATRGTLPTPRSALVVLVRRDGRCPTGPARDERGRGSVDPEAMLVDQEFFAFLARDAGDDAPFECLARAGFRVRESRALAPTGWLRLGLLGDLQWVFFLRSPFATGAALPVVYARARLPYGFGAEAAVSLTAGTTFSDPAITRAGAGLSLAVEWGPRSVLPRLISAGVMLHLATGQRDDEPLVSPYAAIDLSTLVDLAGGR